MSNRQSNPIARVEGIAFSARQAYLVAPFAINKLSKLGRPVRLDLLLSGRVAFINSKEEAFNQMAHELRLARSIPQH